jgi:hypothetical protein
MGVVRCHLGSALLPVGPQIFSNSRRERQNHDRDVERAVAFAAAEKQINQHDAETQAKPASDELAFAQADDCLKPNLECEQAKDQEQRCDADNQQEQRA